MKPIRSRLPEAPKADPWISPTSVTAFFLFIPKRNLDLTGKPMRRQPIRTRACLRKAANIAEKMIASP